MFTVPLRDSRQRCGVFLNVGSKIFGWLALYSVVGFGQIRIVEDPQDVTVCVGEDAKFMTETNGGGGITTWFINGDLYDDLSLEKRNLLPLSGIMITIEGTTLQTLTVRYNATFNGLGVQSGVVLTNGSSVRSNIAYLFYETNHQPRVTGLNATENDTTAEVYWNEPDSGLTTRYLFGVYDGNNNLVANYTSNTIHISYDLPPRVNDTCQYLEFRVTADQCPGPDSEFIQTEATTFIYRKPDIEPVTAQFDNKTVQVYWPSDGNSTFWIVVTDLDSGTQSLITHNGTPPFSYTPAFCGQFNLNFEVSPAQCAEESAFTHSDSISFTIDCPTTVTETETVVTDHSSGTQASYPSLLLTIAAIIPLLKWQH